MSCGIYKITNPKGSIYIGQSQNIEKRWYRYRNTTCHDQPRLYNSLIKYGADNHFFEILCHCTKEELSSLEKYYIKLFDSFSTELGMNLQTGGGNYSLSNETKLKISIKRKLNPKNPNSINALLKNRGINGMLGKRHSEESKQKMRKPKPTLIGALKQKALS